MISGNRRISFNSKNFKEKPETENTWHKPCQCDVVTAMLEPLGDNPAAIDD
jgi:hypothetical protein